MLNGYTQKLAEEGQPFNDFAWTCAKAFGPMLGLLEDSSLGDEYYIYHQKEEQLAEIAINKFLSMSADERLAYGEEHKQKDILYYEEIIEKIKARNLRIEEMETRVVAWNPPEQYNELKAFMLSQLSKAKSDTGFLNRQLEEARTVTPMDLWQEAVDRAIRDRAYHREEGVQMLKQHEQDIQWINNLKEILK